MIILIDILQNIYNYTACLPHYFMNAIVEISFRDNDCITTSDNFLRKKDIEKLNNRFCLLNNLQQEEINEFYRSLISYARPEKVNNAGLGLVEIVRKSDGSVRYKYLMLIIIILSSNYKL